MIFGVSFSALDARSKFYDTKGFKSALERVFADENMSHDVKKVKMESIYKSEIEKVKNAHYALLIAIKEQQKASLKKEKENYLQRERENEIYRTYLASQIKGSSILKDFQTMRY